MKKIQNFTLIEMMAVMIIAAVLTALAVPAFKALTTGSAVGETSAIFKNSLDVAQSRAISQRQYVAAVIDHKGQRTNANDTQAIRICQLSVEMDATGTIEEYHFKEWMPESSWQELSYGASILGAAQNKSSLKAFTEGNSISSTLGNLPSLKKIPKDDTASPGTMTCPAVIYTVYGGTYEPSSETWFMIGEATLADGKMIYRNKDDSGEPANFLRIKLNPFTGRTKVISEEEASE